VSKRADRRYLRDVAYADPSGLMARAGLYDYQQPRIDIIAEALDALGPIDGRVVADVGCGNGRYVDALRAGGAKVVGVDLSPGMLAGASSPRTELVTADAEALPLASAALDAVLMMHMLYHVPEPERAVGESARVLRSGGRVLVATNGERHLAEMNALWLPLLDRAGIRGNLEDVGLVNPRLTVGTAQEHVCESFGEVSERWLRSVVVVTDAAPVIRHASSTTGAHLVGERRDALLSEFAAEVDSQIRRDGQFRITTEVVFLSATKP
jgi:SAM-dependent methyltransferase